MNELLRSTEARSKAGAPEANRRIIVRPRSVPRVPWGNQLLLLFQVAPRLRINYTTSLDVECFLGRELDAEMCGIFFSLSTSGPVLPAEETATLLRNRGPDSFQTHTIQLESRPGQDSVEKLSLTFISTVLALRGDHVHAQPLVDDASKSVLCWNGEAWKISDDPVQGNDTELIFSLFLDCVKVNGDVASPPDSLGRICNLVNSISGPFSFVFYDGINSRLYYSRDCLGRRSLLQGVDEEGNLRICSICDGTSSTHFEEVDTNGLHMIDLARTFHDDSLDTTVLNHAGRASAFNITTIPWLSKDDATTPTYFLVCPWRSRPREYHADYSCRRIPSPL